MVANGKFNIDKAAQLFVDVVRFSPVRNVHEMPFTYEFMQFQFQLAHPCFMKKNIRLIRLLQEQSRFQSMFMFSYQ